MPPAIRKTKPDAPPPPPDGKRALTAAPRQFQRAMTPAAAPGDDLAQRPQVRGKLIDWHGALAQVSGTLTVACGKQGLSTGAARAAVAQLRWVADDMERELFG